MRALRAFAILGSLSLAGGLSAQSLAEHAAAAAGATVGTAAGKPISNALTKIFGQADHATATAAGTKDRPKVPVKPTVISGQNSGSSKASHLAPASSGGGGAISEASSAIERSRANRPSPSTAGHHSAPVTATVQFSAPFQISAAEPPLKEPSIQELESIQLGASHSDLLTVLGKPASHVIVPDDDGHLRESCQYWAQGRQIGTVRLDNGQVVKVDVYSRN